jgi:transcriptional regulator with XRE-family HTH domain
MHCRQHDEPRNIIRKLRDQRGIASDRQLAIVAGLHQPTLSRYLTGVTKSMDVENFRLLAQALGVTLSELLGEVPLSSGGVLREVMLLMQDLPPSMQGALLAAGRAMAQASETDREKKPPG